jgi:hypothetical protein
MIDIDQNSFRYMIVSDRAVSLGREDGRTVEQEQ